MVGVARIRATGASGRDGESAIDRQAGRYEYDGDKFCAIFFILISNQPWIIAELVIGCNLQHDADTLVRYVLRSFLYIKVELFFSPAFFLGFLERNKHSLKCSCYKMYLNNFV